MEDIKSVVDYDVIGEEAHPRLVVITLMEYRQLVSDVPVGTFLSGGLDSSIISAVIQVNFQILCRSLSQSKFSFSKISFAIASATASAGLLLR
mgnify:CR=1 FL=1